MRGGQRRFESEKQTLRLRILRQANLMGPAGLVSIDDSATNILSVRDSHATSTLVHFIADRRFFAGAGEIDGVALKTHDWCDAGAYIRNRIGA